MTSECLKKSGLEAETKRGRSGGGGTGWQKLASPTPEAAWGLGDSVTALLKQLHKGGS